ncbi:MAG: BatA and WFA domain-containing protein [Phycisphaerales bacterium]
MTFLAPWALGAALAAGVPALIVLYMLKLRRRPEPIASTLLWRKSVEDLVANAPFQRLRWSALLVLQLLAIAAIAAGLGRPASRDADAVRGRVIVLIDRSASMNATVPSPLDAARRGADAAASGARTRLDLARERVHRLIDRLGADDVGSQMMIVAFAREPRLLSGFERSRARLRDALDSMTPTDEEADLGAALHLVEGFARQGEGSDGGGAPDDPLPAVVVVSDGGVMPPADGPGFAVAASSVTFDVIEPRLRPGVGSPATGTARTTPAPAPVGASTPGAGTVEPSNLPDNLGIVALAAERSYGDPAIVTLFARLANAGSAPVETVVTVRQDDRAVVRRNVLVPAATEAALGEATVLERLESPGRAVLVVSHAHADLLSDDDVAAALLPAPRALRIALVTDGSPSDPFLRRLLVDATTDPASVDSTPGASIPAGASASEPAGRGDVGSGTAVGTLGAGVVHELALDAYLASPPAVDLVVFDRVAPPRLPGVPSLTIGRAAGPPLAPGGRAPRRAMGWDRQHPLLRHVDLDDLVYNAAGFRLSDEWTALAQGRDGAIVAITSQRGARHAAIAFALPQSNLPVLPTFPVLVQNALDHLAAAGAGQTARIVRPGDPVVVAPRPGVASIVVGASGPSPAVTVAVAPDGQPVALPRFERVGVRTLSSAAPPEDVVAVSMLSELETDVRRREAPLIVSSTPGGARTAIAVESERWPWAVLAALGVLALEWVVYTARAGGRFLSAPWRPPGAHQP